MRYHVGPLGQDCQKQRSKQIRFPSQVPPGFSQTVLDVWASLARGERVDPNSITPGAAETGRETVETHKTYGFQNYPHAYHAWV